MKMSQKNLFVLMFLLSTITPGFAAEKGADFPKKPIKLIVPYAAGSGMDMHARRIAPGVGKILGTSVVIVDKPGADGRLALNEAWKADPDGYTLLTTGMPAPIINEKLFPVNYRFKEFTQIYSWTRENMVLVVNAETWKTPEEFLTAARNKSLSGGLSGIGSVSQVAGLLLEEAGKFKPVNWVTFGGGGETMASLAGKHIEFGITTASSAKSLVDAGKLRCLLVFSSVKDPLFPNALLPKELGLQENMTPLVSVRLVFGPPKLPARIVAIIENAFARAAQEPDYRDWAQKARVEIALLSHQQCSDYVETVEKEISKYVDKIKIKK